MYRFETVQCCTTAVSRMYYNHDIYKLRSRKKDVKLRPEFSKFRRRSRRMPVAPSRNLLLSLS